MPMDARTYEPLPRGDMHIKLKLTGSVDKRRLFDFICGRLDSDYPQADGSVAEHRTYDPKECQVCGGWTWRMATISAGELRRLATQINEYPGLRGHLKLKIKYFERPDKCRNSIVAGARKAMGFSG